MDPISAAQPIAWGHEPSRERHGLSFKSRADTIGNVGPAAVVFVFILLSD